VTRESRIKLRDGRQVGFAEFGDPGGRPILFCHGFPASRLDARLGHEAALRLKARLIAPDRPGYGLSDFQAGRRLSDWPRDVAELADQLSLEKFSVLGISGGGPYAVACAALIPERLATVGIVCGLGPTRFGEDTALMNPFARLSFAMARNLPAVSQLFNRAIAPVVRGNPRLMLKLLASELPPPDREVLADPAAFSLFADALREAFRSGGRGAALDLLIYARPWELPIGSISVPCHLWHGEQDTTVPAAMGRRLATAIPGCRAQFFPEEGHFSLPVRRMGDFIAALN
jgi:pimeloyl-ACP methyl ester carboxylesterase